MRSRCLLMGEYTVEIDNADGVSVVGDTIQRGSQDIELTLTLRAEGSILVDPDDEARAAFVYGGPGGSALPGAYLGSTVWKWLGTNNNMEEYNPSGRNLATSVTIAIPPAIDASGALLASVDADPNDPCRLNWPHRDLPVAVEITASSTTRIPEIGTTGRPMASFSISCPPAAAASRAVGLVPENPVTLD